MQYQFKNELLKLAEKEYINKEIYNTFLDRIKRDPDLVRDSNPTDHFCSMLLLFDQNKNKVFLGHHKKANDWISPGGHIELDEDPYNAALREFKEELKLDPTKIKAELFDLAYFHLPDNIYKCRIHYDFWYLIQHPEEKITVNEKEFYDARWVDLNKALNLVKQPEYRTIIKNLIKVYL